MVKTKFNEVMERHDRFKAHKVLASIIMTNGMSLDNATVVAIGTGTKCFSNINDDENGTILHDMHAEVLARRSFVRFLCKQLNAMMMSKWISGKPTTTALHFFFSFRKIVNIPVGRERG